MITEQYVNSCYSIILNKHSKVRKDKLLFRDIMETLSEYTTSKKEKKEIPINIQNKLECLLKICELKLEDKTDDNIMDSLSLSEKFRPLHDFLHSKREEQLHENDILDNIKQIRLRKKLGSLLTNHDKLGNFLTVIKDGSFESIDDIVLDYENIVKTLYTNMMDNNRSAMIEATSSLDLMKDDYTHVVETIVKKYDKCNKTSTGFPILDNEVLNGGFDASRLYVFGGSSGSGKSTILCNMMTNAATIPITKIDKVQKKEGKDVYVYITLENTIEESLLRIYQSIFNKTLVQVLRDISSNVNIKAEVIRELDKNNSTIIMHYFPASSISTLDIMTVLDDAISTYGKDSIKGLYIDYLDLLRTDIKYDIYRLELGQITVALKSLAVEYAIPVITATQLGRETYKIQTSQELNLAQIGESIKKVEHADFVALLSKDPVDDKVVHFKVGKNRSGKSGLSLDFNVNFEVFRFQTAVKMANSKKPNATNENSMGFGGFGDI